ncbi:MAG: glycoside hydrolase family 99-like domain-containing protein [Clostridia bacterium]|nr:glycoside hydrolase family 99-like domain-containing protein [Clostridia bacterium]
MNNYDIAAFIWPAYTGNDDRARMFWREGYGEWQSVQNAKKNSALKPKDYVWDRRPLWGYVNEADPRVMEMEIECAKEHGVNVFIYDWYWYDDRPFLANCLEEGYLKARNNDLVKFYIMWSNHDAPHVWNIDLSDEIPYETIWRADVDRDIFNKLVDLWIERYFTHPSYYKIDGCPVFMMYDVLNFVKGMGSVEKAREALEHFRQRVCESGFPGLHLQCVMTEHKDRVVKRHGMDFADLYRALGFDSLTEYQWKVFNEMRGDYLDSIRAAKENYNEMDKLDGILYFPQVSVGWDNNPRFKNFMPSVIKNNTPKNVELAMRQAKTFVDTHSLPAPLVIVNSWNEWTETSYLEPDNLNGYGYLEAIKRVFVDKNG